MQYLSIMCVKIAFTPLGVKTAKLRPFASAKFAANDSWNQSQRKNQLFCKHHKGKKSQCESFFPRLIATEKQKLSRTVARRKF